mgnify:FL=1|jgi:hypothetical protein|tara:strand:- start:16619 stop:17047 length:429 start_codon:yes stop_codon:yes gene_type:complete
MVIDFFNNLNPFIGSLFKNELTVTILHTLGVFLLNAVSYSYILVKFYKVLCYSKMTFDWLPMINPYVWPFSVFNVLTGPYFALWSRILPTIKFEKSSVEISGIIALESLNSLVYFLVKLTNMLVVFLEETELSIVKDLDLDV